MNIVKGKNKATNVLLVLVLVAGLIVLAPMAINSGKEIFSSTTQVETIGNASLSGNGPWADNLVSLQIDAKDKYAGTAVDPTYKVYMEKPEDWLNPRADFDDSENYESYSSSSGTATVQDKPGTYYVVATLSGFNSEFFTISIPDTPETETESLSDYNSAPNVVKVQFADAPASLTVTSGTATLVNDSSYEDDFDINFEIADDDEARMWKAVITDVEGFRDDADNDDVSDEGINKIVLKVNGKSYTLMDLDNGINLFDDDDDGEVEIDLQGFTLSDGNDIDFNFDLEGATGDYTGANDEIWGEGEGNFLSVLVRDIEGTSLGTGYITS